MSLAQMSLLRRILAAGETTVDLPLPAMRANFEEFLSRFPAIDGVLVEQVAGFGPADAEWLEVAAGRGRKAAIVYLHGGGFVTGSLRSHRMIAARLARAAGLPVCHLDYRKAPESPHPTALEDGVALCRHLRETGTRDLALAGDSAGAGLAVALAALLAEEGAPPRALALFSPWLDYRGCRSVDTQGDPMVRRPGLEKMAALYLDGADPDAASPLARDLRALPPTLLQAGAADALLDDSLALDARLRADGVACELVVWPGMIHSWQIFAGRLEEADQALERAGRFLADRLRD